MKAPIFLKSIFFIFIISCGSVPQHPIVSTPKYQANYYTEIQKGFIGVSQYDRLRPAEFNLLNGFGADINQFQKIYDLETVTDIAKFMIRDNSGSIGTDIGIVAAKQLLNMECRYAGIELNNPKPPYHPDHFTRYWLHPSVRCLYMAEKQNFKYYTIRLISKENKTIGNNPIGKECYLFLFFDKNDEYQGHIAAMK
jgi:hypothetical protein